MKFLPLTPDYPKSPAFTAGVARTFHAFPDKLDAGMWAGAFRNWRCVIPVSAYYEGCIGQQARDGMPQPRSLPEAAWSAAVTRVLVNFHDFTMKNFEQENTAGTYPHI